MEEGHRGSGQAEKVHEEGVQSTVPARHTQIESSFPSTAKVPPGKFLLFLMTQLKRPWEKLEKLPGNAPFLAFFVVIVIHRPAYPFPNHTFSTCKDF